MKQRVGQKVIVRATRVEVHGYAKASDARKVEVVWDSPSGRRRIRVFSAEVVFVPSPDRPWSGVAIPASQIPFSREVSATARVYS